MLDFAGLLDMVVIAAGGYVGYLFFRTTDERVLAILKKRYEFSQFSAVGTRIFGAIYLLSGALIFCIPIFLPCRGWWFNLLGMFVFGVGATPGLFGIISIFNAREVRL